MELDFKIDDFNGPLDLLLHLIKENKMDILNIEIESITEQYIEYLNKMEEMNLEVTSNYLLMASELLYIKSKMLLPKPKDDEEEEEDPREELVNRLLEYEAYKEITKTLKEKEKLRKEIYTRAPSDIGEYIEPETNIHNTLNIDDLLDALKKFLERQKENKPIRTQVTEKEVTVAERRKKIKDIILKKKRVSFFELFEDYNKEYVVATFLAIHEMAKAKELILELKEDYNDKNRGIRIDFLGNKIKLTTKKEHREYYQKLIENPETNSLSQASLETLAIIAYNQPITRIQVDELRGVSSSQMLRKLVAKGFLKESGRSDLPGRPILYETTSEFLDYFGLNSIDDLPNMRDFITPEENEETNDVDLYHSKYKENLV